MRACLFAFALLIATLGATPPARAGCWPSDSIPIVCWLDTYGLACTEHHKLTSARAVMYPEPRYSYYEFEATHWWTAASEVACPPSRTTKFTSVWDRETGKAEETASTSISTLSLYAYCSKNPWTGQGPPTVQTCSAPTGDPNAGIPVTWAMLSQSQKNNLLKVEEPLHTRCQQIEPAPEAPQWLKGNSIVRVVVAHHEYQKIEWHLWFRDFGPWQEVAAPKPKSILMTTIEYTERRIATTTRRFWLNKPGSWKVVAVPKPISFVAQAVAQVSSTGVSIECPGAVFNVQ